MYCNNLDLFMLETLEKLFNSKARVRLLRFFLNHPKEKFLLPEISSRVKINSKGIRKEVNNLVKSGFLKIKQANKKKYYFSNPKFILYDELKELVFKGNPASSKEIAKKIKNVGQIKLALISGSLINSEKGRVDIFIVGENLNKVKLKRFLEDIESEIGKGISYAAMNADEFNYRRNMFDKFILDILEGPREILIDRMKIS